MSREWEDRQAGNRPILHEETPQQLDLNLSLVSCLTSKYDKNEWRASFLDNNSIFTLPGQNEEKTKDNCGEWSRALSCTHADHVHKQMTLSGEKHDVFAIKHSCFNPRCPVCSPQWQSRQARNTADKLIQATNLYRQIGMRGLKLDHSVFSPPQEYAKELIRTKGGYRTLRTEFRRILKKAGMLGAAVIFHPFRQNDDREENFNPDMPIGIWYLSPHFHVIGAGYLMNSSNFFNLTGWVYKKMGNRASIKGTVQYLLSHCGICDEFQAVTYVGIFSNNKIVIDSSWTEIEPIKCSLCKEPLHEYGFKKLDDGNYVVDYSEDLGEYKHKVTYRTYKISDNAMNKYESLITDNSKKHESGYIRIDDRPIKATKSRILDLIKRIKEF